MGGRNEGHPRPVPCAIDLFAGAGGFGLGLSAAGIHVAASLDKDPDSVASIAANPSVGPRLLFDTDIEDFGPRAMERSLHNLSPRFRVDLVFGGPPCQGWSKVGRGKLRSLGRILPESSPMADARNQLYVPFLQYVAHFHPKAVMMENVRGMSSYYGYDGSKVVAAGLSSLGYRSEVVPLDAARFGVPQHRKRLVIVGIREDLGTSFVPPDAAAPDLELRRTALTVRDAIRDLPWAPPDNTRGIMPYHPRAEPSAYLRLLRPDWMNGTITDHTTRPHRAQDVEAFRSLEQDGIYADLPEHLKRYRDDIFVDKYHRLAWDKPSPCLTAHLAKDGYSHIHPSQARTISVREAARIQSFPDWYVISGSMGSQFRQIGNSVPPLLAYALGRSIMGCLDMPPISSWRLLSRHAKSHYVS
jgi:DNA (cytosine-5)-methyltransferase 1